MRGERLLENDNLFFWEKECPFCKKVWKALNVTQINSRVDRSRRIKPVEVTSIGAKDPVFKRHKDWITGTPVVVIDGIPYFGATSVGYYKGVFEAHFEDEILPWLQ